MLHRLVRLIIALSVIAPSLAWGWGCTGHEVVALIALKNLKPEVAAQVRTLLAAQDHNYPGRYCSDISLDPIAYYATWADDYRGSHPETAPWHYWDIPLKLTSARETQFCDQGCVVQALRDQLAVLKDPARDVAQRGDALKFIVHFVGDLHQPLHIADNNDRGGNCVPADFLHTKTKETDAAAGNYTPNLHGIWDTELVENIGGVTTRTQTSVEAFADRISLDQGAVIQQSTSARVDFVAWGLESHSVAQRDPYSQLPRKIKAVKNSDPVTQCSDRNTSENLAKRHEAIESSYIGAVSNDVQVQLARAGGRLAAVLNSALMTAQ